MGIKEINMGGFTSPCCFGALQPHLKEQDKRGSRRKRLHFTEITEFGRDLQGHGVQPSKPALPQSSLNHVPQVPHPEHLSQGRLTNPLAALKNHTEMLMRSSGFCFRQGEKKKKTKSKGLWCSGRFSPSLPSRPLLATPQKLPLSAGHS